MSEETMKAEPGLKHTPGPWHVEKYNCRYELWPEKHLELYTYVGVVQRELDADFIVRACNSHDALVEAVQTALGEFGGDEPNRKTQPWSNRVYHVLKAALALAEGSKES